MTDTKQILKEARARQRNETTARQMHAAATLRDIFLRGVKKPTRAWVMNGEMMSAPRKAEPAMIYTVCVTRPASGMSACYGILVIDTIDGRSVIRNINSLSAIAARLRQMGDGSILVKGTGFNRSQYIADTLSCVLYGSPGLLKSEYLGTW